MAGAGVTEIAFEAVGSPEDLPNAPESLADASAPSGARQTHFWTHLGAISGYILAHLGSLLPLVSSFFPAYLSNLFVHIFSNSFLARFSLFWGDLGSFGKV